MGVCTMSGDPSQGGCADSPSDHRDDMLRLLNPKYCWKSGGKKRRYVKCKQLYSQY